MVSSQNFSVTPLHHILQRLMRLCRPLCLAIPLWAASTGLVSAESWKVNLQDADIKAFINEVATITDQNFVLDPRINGNVTVISNKALSRDEIYQLFLSVMQVNGIAAIDSGTTIKLVPDNVAKQSGVAVDLQGNSVGEALATRVIYLTNTQAAEVLGVIRPLMPQSAHAAAVPGVNALVLSDRADSLNQLTALIRDLDSNVNDSLQVIPLRHVDAERMMELIKQDYDVIKKITPRDEVIKIFEERGEDYKLKLINDMPGEEAFGLYHHQEYVDMCRGPHVPNTRFLKVFKLTKMSGAYWRGDAKNEQLQRIYGTAWADKKDLKAYIQRIEEAEKRDHRKIGKALNLFHMQEQAPGMVFWHANGWTIYQVLEQYMRKVQNDNGYEEIKTPQIVDRSLWERSGHWGNYATNMFTTSSENRDYAVKPMNCPCHVQVFNQGLKSYRELPLRMAEFGSCHRNEPSGSLHGLMRVRGFTQDDAHIFCTQAQIQQEVADFIKLTLAVYEDHHEALDPS